MTNTATAPSSVPAASAEPNRFAQPLTPESLAALLAQRQQRVDGWTPVKVACFLVQLAETMSVKSACAYVNMSTASAYALRNHPDAAEFRAAWECARSARFEELTDLAFDRVRNGVEKNRWWRDQKVGYDIVFSDRLLIALLDKTDPLRHAPEATPAAAPVALAPVPLTDARLADRIDEVAVATSPTVPLAQDFAISAGLATGRMGWDPDDDDDGELPPEIAADVAAIFARQKAAIDAQAEITARFDAMAEGRQQAYREIELGLAEVDLEDAQTEREIKSMRRALTSSGCSYSDDAPKRPHKAGAGGRARALRLHQP